ncbi:MAG TPA: hypothetical protein VIJ93_14615 [bacterium]
MKPFILLLLAFAMFQSRQANAQDDRKHGRGDGGGGLGSSNFSGGDNGRRSGDNGSGGEVKQSNQQVTKQPRAKRQPRTQSQNSLQRNGLGNQNFKLNRPAGNFNQNPGTIQNGVGSTTNHFQKNKNNLSVGGPTSNHFQKNGNNVNTSGTTPNHFRKNGNGLNASGTTQNHFRNNGNNQNSQTVQGHQARSTQSISPKLRQMGITHIPARITNQKHILTADNRHSVITYPTTGPRGRPVNATVIASNHMNTTIVQNHMTSITANVNFRNQINNFSTSEIRPNNYYWHTWNGNNYCHYYDNWGYHWYGWYVGSNCFWTRYYYNNWWWYDSGYSRWCYWHDGGWWWQDPSNVSVVYVYNNGNYVPANTTETVNVAAPQTNLSEIAFKSKDGTRMVKIAADSGDAFLYDTSDSSSKPFYLASNVKSVKFSYGVDGKPSQIMVTLNDDSFSLFDSDGNPFQANGN